MDPPGGLGEGLGGLAELASEANSICTVGALIITYTILGVPSYNILPNPNRIVKAPILVLLSRQTLDHPGSNQCILALYKFLPCSLLLQQKSSA